MKAMCWYQLAHMLISMSCHILMLWWYADIFYNFRYVFVTVFRDVFVTQTFLWFSLHNVFITVFHYIFVTWTFLTIFVIYHFHNDFLWRFRHTDISCDFRNVFTTVFITFSSHRHLFRFSSRFLRFTTIMWYMSGVSQKLVFTFFAKSMQNLIKRIGPYEQAWQAAFNP